AGERRPAAVVVHAAQRAGRADAALDHGDGPRAVVDAPAEAAVAVEGDGGGRRVVVGHAAATGKPAAGERQAVQVQRAVDRDRAGSQRAGVADADGAAIVDRRAEAVRPGAVDSEQSTAAELQAVRAGDRRADRKDTG